LPAIAAPSSPAFSAIWPSGVWIALWTISIPKRWSSLSALSLARISEAAPAQHRRPGQCLARPPRACGVQAVVNPVLEVRSSVNYS
jgi:hypothetical protein